MADVRRARRDAEKAAREALNGTLVDKAGELGVALAEQASTMQDVAAARAKAHAIIEAAQAEGAALISTAQGEASKADAAYAAAWNAGKDAGWSPAQLRAMGYAKPPPARRAGSTTPPNSASAAPQAGNDADRHTGPGDDGEHVANVA